MDAALLRHFCSAERQYRTPWNTAQARSHRANGLATAAGAVVLARDGEGPNITHVTAGRIVTRHLRHEHMGAAWAPRRLRYPGGSLFPTPGRAPNYYDLIVTAIWRPWQEIVLDFFTQRDRPL
jgi:stage V sporulation protein AD